MVAILATLQKPHPALKDRMAEINAFIQSQAKLSLNRWESTIEGIKEEYLSEAHSFPWIIGFSGGKDSTLVVHAAFEALLRVPPSMRIRPIHIVSNDTLVESPMIIEQMKNTQRLLLQAVNNFKLPIVVRTTTPDISQSFWVLLIGRGYPSPNQSLRWCTDRLKVSPTSKYILDNVCTHGAVIVVLGVRRDESSSRRIIIDKYQNIGNSNLATHPSLRGAYIYRPIVDLTLDDVWRILGSCPPPWGGDHKSLIELYRDANGGECPIILSEDDAPGCGTNSSRFGCWTCTVVEKDKSLQGFVDSGKSHYSCLLDFRDWLKSIRNMHEHRSMKRRNGKVSFGTSGKHIPGPFTLTARKMILDKLLEVQSTYGAELISSDEISIIKSTWAEDLIKTGRI